MYAAPLKLVKVACKLGRAEARELDEVTNEMGLIEESGVDGEPTPFRVRRLSCVGQDTLKPRYPLEQLWRETDLCLEHLDEPTMAETDTPGDLVHGRAG